MLNLRFKWTVLSSLFDVIEEIPTANKMIADKEKYSKQECFDYAKYIMDNMRKRAKTETDVFGLENIPEDNFVMYANHQGKYDALGILLALDKPCSVLWAKKQADRLLSRQICGLVDAVVIDLDDNRDKVKAIMDATEYVKNGNSLLMFPEGGYTDNRNNLQEFQTGCFHCSLRTRTPIVPVALYDSYKSMNSNTFEKVRTEVHFLPTITFEEYGKLKKAELAELVRSRIEAKLDELKAAKGEYTPAAEQ